jgi:hypothetical protein
MRCHRSVSNTLTRRCASRAKNLRLRLSILQETPVPQAFPILSHRAVDAAPMWLRRFDGEQRPTARTLSRDFWQQKNFHAHRLRVSSPLAKTGFLGESQAVIRVALFVLGCHRDARSAIDASLRADEVPRRRCRRRRCANSDAEFGFEQVVDRLRVSLAAGRLHHLADEPAHQLRPGAGLRDLVGIGGDDVVDDLFDRT